MLKAIDFIRSFVDFCGWRMPVLADGRWSDLHESDAEMTPKEMRRDGGEGQGAGLSSRWLVGAFFPGQRKIMLAQQCLLSVTVV